MNKLSDEIIQIIIHYVDYKTLVLLGSVSKRFHNHSLDNLLWKELFSFEFPHSFTSITENYKIIWRKKFKLFYRWRIGNFKHDCVSLNHNQVNEGEMGETRYGNFVYTSSNQRLVYFYDKELVMYDLSRRQVVLEYKDLYKSARPSALYVYENYTLIGYTNGRFECIQGNIFQWSLELHDSIHMIRMNLSFLIILCADFTLYIYEWNDNVDMDSTASHHCKEWSLKRLYKLKSTICSLPVDLKLHSNILSILYQMTFYDGTCSPGLQVLQITKSKIQSLLHSFTFEPCHGIMSTLIFGVNGWILAGFQDNFIKIYAPNCRVETLYLDGGVVSLALDEYGKLVVGTRDGISIWQLVMNQSTSTNNSTHEYVHLMDSKWKESWSCKSFSPNQIAFDDDYILFMDKKRVGIQIYDFT